MICALCSSKSVVDFSVVISEQEGKTFRVVHVHANATKLEVIREDLELSANSDSNSVLSLG